MESLYSVEEAARLLGGISKWTVHAWLSQGKLRRTKVGGRTMIRESELQKVIGFLKKNSKVKVEVSGHTDNTGSKQHNEQLSENRARTVYEYLASNGIAKERLTYHGYGDTKPIATNASEAGRAQNRRTEFMITAVE